MADYKAKRAKFKADSTLEDLKNGSSPLYLADGDLDPFNVTNLDDRISVHVWAGAAAYQPANTPLTIKPGEQYEVTPETGDVVINIFTNDGEEALVLIEVS